jgi:bifunctional non-homologous end joining protein LigD
LVKAVKTSVDVEGQLLTLTNLDKIYWPESGYTKGDLINYYASVARPLLQFIYNRPITLNRFPDGIKGQSFYQKDCPDNAPPWIKTHPEPSNSSTKTTDYIVCNDLPTLIYVANLGSIEIHPWMTNIHTPDYPDLAVIDLDPDPPSGFKETVAVAKCLKHMLDRLGLFAALKTSGATGLHLYIPIKPVYDFQTVTKFVENLSKPVISSFPQLATNERMVKRRKGRVYIDYMQNLKGKTIASVFSVRPIESAPVSTPIHWAQLDNIRPEQFNIKTVPSLLDSGSLPDFNMLLKSNADQLLPVGLI